MSTDHPPNRGGARAGAGRPVKIDRPATIHLRLEMSEKTAFVHAAQRSPERTLTDWILAAARERLRRGKVED